jgi:hypothetical protein
LAGKTAKVIRLNKCITEAEVVEAIKSMKRRKAADVLWFRAELLQAGVLRGVGINADGAVQ